MSQTIGFFDDWAAHPVGSTVIFALLRTGVRCSGRVEDEPPSPRRPSGPPRPEIGQRGQGGYSLSSRLRFRSASKTIIFRNPDCSPNTSNKSTDRFSENHILEPASEFVGARRVLGDHDAVQICQGVGRIAESRSSGRRPTSGGMREGVCRDSIGRKGRSI